MVIQNRKRKLTVNLQMVAFSIVWVEFVFNAGEAWRRGRYQSWTSNDKIRLDWLTLRDIWWI